ncbi:hypothetical protein PV10_01752 [Exophiala mesophila]|uniref:Uncharacterized protein n=1 Tax=Exophiala mesophila TaxID=212818 RepID=A0A0D1ZU58_EXOME|nr:uncharacterized protein PV10_01752 [Exophiala mesophila]KIV98062.1 hypothetical protein PV10_01752 [Exophiala mesophila]
MILFQPAEALVMAFVPQSLPSGPPFGRTIPANTHLEVREHLKHDHRPRRAKLFWVLNNGQVAEAHEGMSISIECPTVTLWLPEEKRSPYPFDVEDWSEAIEKSSLATSYIFNWHSEYGGGLWLDESHGLEAARKIQSHPWISTTLFDNSESEEEDKSTKTSLDGDKIVSWRNAVTASQAAKAES